MKRHLYVKLQDWRTSKNRTPLILRGARQVGKSYLLKQFGKNDFSHYHHFDFERNKNKLVPLFSKSLDANEIIENLSIMIGTQIDIKNDLVIFDEIQSCPEALNSLKYFCEDLPELAICAAGSLLGITFGEISFPVGKVCYLDLYPLNFEEFLMNKNNDLLYNAFLSSLEKCSVSTLVHTELLECLKEYYVIGGMPAVVRAYLMEKNKVDGFKLARIMQKQLVDSYINDINKHSGKINALHISSVLENIPIQLVSNVDTSVQRYRFKDVIPKRKGFADFQGPIDWLCKAGLIIKVPVCLKSKVPLKAFCKNNIFKLYLFDIGILGAMLELSPNSIYNEDYGLIEGFFAENFVATELLSTGHDQLYSWTERNSEIEFIIDIEGELLPLEVKSGIRVKAQSLKQYILKYNPSKAVIVSSKALKISENIVQYYPLYFSSKYNCFLKK
jgi:uncharacterized protein